MTNSSDGETKKNQRKNKDETMAFITYTYANKSYKENKAKKKHEMASR